MAAAGGHRQELPQGGKTREGGQGHQPGRTAEKCQTHEGTLLPKAPQLGEVLGDVGEHNRADRHEHQGHRQGVDEHQVIGHVDSPQAHGHKEQAHPAGHQKRQGPFHIDLGQGDQGAHQGAGAPHHHQHALHKGAQGDQGLQPQQHPDASHHHHRVAQHGGGQRALHGLIEPEVERNLGAFAHGPGDQGQQNQGDARGEGNVVVGHVGGPALKAVKIPGARDRQQGNHPRQKDEVANPLGEEGIAGALHHQRLVVPGAHDQVGAQGEQLEDDVAEKQGIGEHQGAQARFKKTQGAKKPRPAPIHLQIGNRIDLHQHVQSCDHRHGDQGGLGDQAIKPDAQACGVQPGPAEGEGSVDG